MNFGKEADKRGKEAETRVHDLEVQLVQPFRRWMN